jgi:hypothetical protein
MKKYFIILLFFMTAGFGFSQGFDTVSFQLDSLHKVKIIPMQYHTEKGQFSYELSTLQILTDTAIHKLNITASLDAGDSTGGVIGVQKWTNGNIDSTGTINLSQQTKNVKYFYLPYCGGYLFFIIKLDNATAVQKVKGKLLFIRK